MVAAVTNLCQGLVGIVQTKERATALFCMQIGVYQGDPLAVCHHFQCSDEHPSGYHYPVTPPPWLLTDHIQPPVQPAPVCQALLECTEWWLHWSGRKPKVPKCCSLAVVASSGNAYNPQLSLYSVRGFLGAPISIHNIQEETSLH